MDIEQPVKVKTKKNKLIVKKSKSTPTQHKISSTSKSKKSVINQYAKKVNLKK